jgi:hypothetical protein
VCCVSTVLHQMRIEQPAIWEFVTLGGTLWKDRLVFQNRRPAKLQPALAA